MKTKIKSYNFDKKLLSVGAKVAGITPATSIAKNRSARHEPAEIEGRGSTRVAACLPLEFEGGLSGSFATALALGASLFLSLPNTLFPSENQDTLSSMAAINMMELPSLPNEQMGGADNWRSCPSEKVFDQQTREERTRKDSRDQFTNLDRNSPEPSWNRIQPKERPDPAITIMMPDDPTFEESFTRSPLGKVSHSTYTVKGEGATFTASYSVIPKIALSLAGEKTIFIKARDTIMEKTHGEQSSLESAQYMGVSGMKLAYRTRPSEETPSFNGVAYMFISGRTLVVFNAVISDLHPADYANRYFETIEVTRSLASADRPDSNR